MDQTAQQPQQNPQKSVSWTKILITVLIVVFVTAVLTSAVWYFVLNKSETDSDPVKVSTPTKQATPSAKTSTKSAEKDKTAGWKTYSNESLGFSIKYPKGWDYNDKTKYEIQSCDPGPNIGEGLLLLGRKSLKCTGVAHMSLWDEKVEFVVFSTTKFDPLKSIIEEKYTDITVDGEKAVKNFKSETSAGPRCTCTKIFVNHSNKGFMIEFVNKDLQGNYDPIYNTILSTFKFLD